MVILSEVAALYDLLQAAADFWNHLQNGWYHASTELDEFPIKVALLRAKHAQWTDLLRKFGMAEDKHLEPLVDAAARILEREENYVRKMQKSRCLRLRRRAFPGQLTYILNSMLEIVDASPQLLDTRLQACALLKRSVAQTPLSLSFGPDHKYVPLSGSLAELRLALEETGGSRVVTLYGGPGAGKSCSVKHLALHYQRFCGEDSTNSRFPVGVFYLFCGKGAQGRVNNLQAELLENLGGGIGTSVDGAPEQERGYEQGSSVRTRLRFHLAKQRLLIILDDVWEEEALEQLLVPGEGVKYLVTSQVRAIWGDATMVELKNPTMAEARAIMANYTEGLPAKGKFPDAVQSLTDAIIEELEYHPLSLASVGLTINRDRAGDPEQWRAVKESLRRRQHHEVYSQSGPLMYESRYPLPVGPSMMLMVNSLSTKARRLLLLMALLREPEIPEVLLQYFLKLVDPSESQYHFNTQINYLLDRSVIERPRSQEEEISCDEKVDKNRLLKLTNHGLKIHYIRKNNADEIRSIAVSALSSDPAGDHHDHGTGSQFDQLRENAECMGAIMGAMYFVDPFGVEVSVRLQRYAVPWTIPCHQTDAPNLLERSRRWKFSLQGLVWLLNLDGRGDGWEQHAHDCARKILIAFICREELEDESMAFLIHCPRTTTAACSVLMLVLGNFWESTFVHERKTFSSAHGRTMQALLALLHDHAASTGRRAAAIEVLGRVLRYEDDATVLAVARTWEQVLAEGGNPTLQCAVASAFCTGPNPLCLEILAHSGVMDRLLLLLARASTHASVNQYAAQALQRLSECKTLADKIVSIPNSIKTLLTQFLLTHSEQSPKDYDAFAQYYAGNTLVNLSRVPENRPQFVALTGLLEIIVAIFDNLAADRRTSQCLGLPSLGRIAAAILGNLVLTIELRKIIFVQHPDIEDRLKWLQIHLSKKYLNDNQDAVIVTSRTLTILNPANAVRNRPSGALQGCYEVYMGRAQAFQEMGMYVESLSNLSDARHCFKQMPADHARMLPWWELRRLRRRPIFLKAMLEDYKGAMAHANEELEGCRTCDRWQILGERGVLRRLAGGDLTEALADLNEALRLDRRWCDTHKYRCLKQRGLVKHLLGDDAGAFADAEYALRLKRCILPRIDATYDVLGARDLTGLPTNYLDFAL